MFSTIVVGTDGSKDAERALRVTAELAGSRPATSVHVVTAYQPLTASDLRAISADLPEEFRPLLHGHVGAETALSDARLMMEGAGIEAQYHEIDADPAEALLDMVDEYHADLLVVGSRGQGMTGRLLHGSVSTKVLHHAPCSVLAVKA